MSLVLMVLLVVAVWAGWSRIGSLERKLERLEKALYNLQRSGSDAGSGAAPSPAPAAAPDAVAALREARTEPPAQTSAWTPSPAPVHAPGPPRPPSIDEVVVRVVRDYFTGGNLVVRAGIIVLFFGVGFLLKYAAEHARLSIQMRLVAVALGAVALFAVGWSQRQRRRGFSLALQGGAVGILYLTLFAALRFYQLLPAEVTFGLMAALGVAACLLAIRQDSLTLTMLGATGGFLAPILASTGHGSHVLLFSYYALLNVFIVVQAWFKAWRPLNLLAFVFTFGVGTIWGVMRYEPAQFASTEPFLIFFFLAFIAIVVLFAFRTAPRLTHYLDGTLVFGTPVVAMALQMELVRDIPHGRAWSAAGAGIVYLALAAWLRRTQRDGLRLLMECFLAIGIAFLTLAVPLWLDDTATAATWALEGAALMWIGLRQQRRLPVAGGALLQLAAAGAYLARIGTTVAAMPLANTWFMGALLLSVAGLFSAHMASKPNPLLKSLGQVPASLLLVWGLGWWLYAGTHEVHLFVPDRWQSSTLLGFCAATALIAGRLVRPLSWPALRVPALSILPVMMVAAWLWSGRQWHPTSDGGWLAWPAAFAALWLGLWWNEALLPRRIAALLHGIALWLFCLLLSWELGWQIAEITAAGTAWAGAIWALPPVLLLAALTGRSVERWWPARSQEPEFRRWVAFGVTGLLLAWSVWLNAASDGAASPLPYLPLLNPLDIATGVALFAIARWLKAAWRTDTELFAHEQLRLMIAALVAAAFFWLNAVLLRTMHYWSDVPYQFGALTADTAVQASLSIFWTLLALGAMLWANRGGLRVVWFGGAALMTVVVGKLFLVDLVRAGTVARIVSFLVVGGLMLVIGYFSPLPPTTKARAA